MGHKKKTFLKQINFEKIKEFLEKIVRSELNSVFNKRFLASQYANEHAKSNNNTKMNKIYLHVYKLLGKYEKQFLKIFTEGVECEKPALKENEKNRVLTQSSPEQPEKTREDKNRKKDDDAKPNSKITNPMYWKKFDSSSSAPGDNNAQQNELNVKSKDNENKVEECNSNSVNEDETQKKHQLIVTPEGELIENALHLQISYNILSPVPQPAQIPTKTKQEPDSRKRKADTESFEKSRFKKGGTSKLSLSFSKLKRGGIPLRNEVDPKISKITNKSTSPKKEIFASLFESSQKFTPKKNNPEGNEMLNTAMKPSSKVSDSFEVFTSLFETKNFKTPEKSTTKIDLSPTKSSKKYTPKKVECMNKEKMSTPLKNNTPNNSETNNVTSPLSTEKSPMTKGRLGYFQSDAENRFTEPDNSFDIIFQPNEWEEIYDKNNQKMKSSWTNIFVKKINEKNNCCVFSFKGIHFIKGRRKKQLKDIKGRQVKTPFAYGYTSCKFTNCYFFKFLVYCKPNSKEPVKVVFNAQPGRDKYCHPKEERHRRHISGNLRKEFKSTMEDLAPTILAGSLLGKADNVPLFQGNISSTPTPAIIAQMRKERAKEEDKDTDDFLDVVKQLEAYLMDPENEGKKLNGWAPRLQFIPLALVSYSEKQLEIARNLLRTDGVLNLYLDATGSLVRRMKHCKSDVFYYAIIAKNQSMGDKPGIPVAELYTEDNTIKGVLYMLDQFVHDMKTIFNLVEKVATKVETDFSFCLLQACARAFNGSSLIDYVNLCFDIVMNRRPLPKSLVVQHICALHVIKFVSEHLKTLTDKSGPAYTAAMVYFSHLQKCRTIIEFTQLIENGNIIFSSEKLTEEVSKSLETISILECDEKFDDFSKVYSVLENIEGDKEQKKTQREKSKFYQFFHKTLSSIPESQSNKEFAANKFFIPGFMEYLIKDLLAYLPLWSGIMLNFLPDFQNREARDTNSVVESWFRKMKYELHDGVKNQKLGRCFRAHVACNKNIMKAFVFSTKSSRAGKKSKSSTVEKPKKVKITRNKAKCTPSKLKTPQKPMEMWRKKGRDPNMRQGYHKESLKTVFAAHTDEENSDGVSSDATQTTIPKRLSTIPELDGEPASSNFSYRDKVKQNLFTSDVLSAPNENIDENGHALETTAKHQKNESAGNLTMVDTPIGVTFTTLPGSMSAEEIMNYIEDLEFDDAVTRSLLTQNVSTSISVENEIASKTSQKDYQKVPVFSNEVNEEVEKFRDEETTESEHHVSRTNTVNAKSKDEIPSSQFLKTLAMKRKIKPPNNDKDYSVKLRRSMSSYEIIVNDLPDARELLNFESKIVLQCHITPARILCLSNFYFEEETEKYLNDEIVLAFLSLMCDHASLDGYLVEVIPTEFFLSILQCNHLLDRKGRPQSSKLLDILNSKKIPNTWRKLGGEWVTCDVFKNDVIFIPICYSNHWTLIIIIVKKKIVLYLDSNHCYDSFYRDFVLQEVLTNLTDPYFTTFKKEMDINQWKIYCPNDIPLQINMFDCGVHISLISYILCFRMRMEYSSEVMPAVRRFITHQILNTSQIARDGTLYLRRCLSRKTFVSSAFPNTKLKLQTCSPQKNVSTIIYISNILSSLFIATNDVCAFGAGKKCKTPNENMKLCNVCRDFYHLSCDGQTETEDFVCSSCKNKVRHKK